MEITVFAIYALPELILQYQQTKGRAFIRITLSGVAVQAIINSRKKRKHEGTDQYFSVLFNVSLLFKKNLLKIFYHFP